jgi:hypothetical protein
MAVTRQRLPLRLTGEPIAQRAKRGRRSAEVLAYLRARSDGAGYSELLTTFGEPGIKALDRLVSSGDVVRPQRARYVAAVQTEPEHPKVPGGVSNRTVCAMLTVLSTALTTAMNGVSSRVTSPNLSTARPSSIARCPRGRRSR